MKNYFKKTSQIKAFSVVEILIYAAIFTMISVLVINSFIITSSSFLTIRTNRDLLQSGLDSMDKFSREIRQSMNIDLVNSDLSNGSLVLSSLDEYDNLVVSKFIMENSELNLYRDNVLVGNLLSDNIVLDSLIFRRIATSMGEGVKIEMSISDSRSRTNKSINLYNTFILRGGY